MVRANDTIFTTQCLKLQVSWKMISASILLIGLKNHLWAKLQFPAKSLLSFLSSFMTHTRFRSLLLSSEVVVLLLLKEATSSVY